MWKVLGTTEDKTVCECCGKKNLKKTVTLENEAGEIKYMGVDCASKAMIGKKNKTQADFIWKTAQAIEFAKKNIARLGAKECRNRILVFGIACTDNGKDSILFYNDVIVSK